MHNIINKNTPTTSTTTNTKHTNYKYSNMYTTYQLQVQKHVQNTPTTSTATCTKHTNKIYTKSWTKPHQLEFMYRNAPNVPTRVQKQ